MISFFTNNERNQSQISLVLSLLSNGCTFDQIRKIIKCKQDTLHDLVSHYFGKSKDIYYHMRKYLSDEQCLKTKWMISQRKVDLQRNFITKLLYPSFICLFTFLTMIFFKFNLLNQMRTMFELASEDIILIYFDIVLYALSISYLFVLIILCVGIIFLRNPHTRNYLYMHFQAKFTDNLITIYNTGMFSRLLFECFKSGIPTQRSLEILGKLNDMPIVMFLANNCAKKLSDGNSFLDSISSLDTDSSFKEFMQLGLFSNNVIEQLNNYCLFNVSLFESKLRRIVVYYYAFVYIQFTTVAILLYQVIQLPMTAIGSQF